MDPNNIPNERQQVADDHIEQINKILQQYDTP
jgi:hypothetical protein